MTVVIGVPANADPAETRTPIVPDVVKKLDALGVPWEPHEACTLHEPGLSSHRRDGACAGRLAGLVWLA